MAVAEDPEPALKPPDPPTVPGPQNVTGKAAPQPAGLPAPSRVCEPDDPAAPRKPLSPSEQLEQQLKQYQRSLKAGERRVYIAAECAEVPDGFCADCGLSETDKALPATTLSRRETALFKALLRSKVGSSLPVFLPFSQNLLSNGQSGHFQAVGASVVPSGKPEANDETPAAPARGGKPFGALNTIYSLQMTPKWNDKESGTPPLKDSNEILLRVEFQALRPGGVVNLRLEQADGSPDREDALAPSFNVVLMETTFRLASGESALLGTIQPSPVDPTKRAEVLWILTPHEVRGK
jgi:hypothetical protein